jgi:hypothetical protein
VKLALALTALAKNSFGAEGKIGIEPCPFFLNEKLTVAAKYLQQASVAYLVSSHIFIKRGIGQHDRLIAGHQLGISVERGKTQIVELSIRIAEQDNPAPPVGRKTDKASVILPTAPGANVSLRVCGWPGYPMAEPSKSSTSPCGFTHASPKPSGFPQKQSAGPCSG